MKYTKSSQVSGAWAKAAELKPGIKAKIVSETLPQPSQFLDAKGNPKTQDVAKVRFEGLPEPLNVSLNRATINALVDAFGEDSVNWQGNVLRVETEKVRVAGKAVTALYLIPVGYIKTDDENGYAQIVKQGAPVPVLEAEPVDDIPVIEAEEEGRPVINEADLPF